MFKGNKKFILIFASSILGVVLLQYLLPQPINWNKTYLGQSQNPFGSYVAAELLKKTYCKDFKTNKQTLYNLVNNVKNKTSLVIVNDRIDFNKLDVEALYNFLGYGNTVLIAANNFNGPLADSLHLETEVDYSDFYLSIDSLIKKDSVPINFFAKNIKTKKFFLPNVCTKTKFLSFDSTRFKVLAGGNKNQSYLIKRRLNGGTLYLLSMPDVFGNYAIANKPSKDIAYTIFSLLKNETLIWDEYYKSYNVNNTSPLKFILESDALYAAFMLTLLTIILYMIFEGRRKQKPIPMLEANTNSTLEFVKVISHVYYNNKGHQNIAIEKIKFFYESVRKKFNVNTNYITTDFIEEVSALSGIENKLVKQLFNYCEFIKKLPEITELELVELNRQIHNFNKNSLR